MRKVKIEVEMSDRLYHAYDTTTLAFGDVNDIYPFRVLNVGLRNRWQTRRNGRIVDLLDIDADLDFFFGDCLTHVDHWQSGYCSNIACRDLINNYSVSCHAHINLLNCAFLMTVHELHCFPLFNRATEDTPNGYRTAVLINLNR